MAKISLSIPVRWSDLDAYGHINNARMLTLLEEARIKAFWSNDQSESGADEELLRSAKILTGAPSSPSITLIAGQRIEYVKPLEWTGEDIRVDLWIGQLGGASLEVSYEVFAPDGELVAKATTAIVIVDAKTGKPCRISDDDRAALSKLVEEPVAFRR